MDNPIVNNGDPVVDAYERITALEAENTALENLFTLQHKRVEAAEKLWQKETGNPDVMPDLGRLVGWLVDENAALKLLVGKVREAVEYGKAPGVATYLTLIQVEDLLNTEKGESDGNI